MTARGGAAQSSIAHPVAWNEVRAGDLITIEGYPCLVNRLLPADDLSFPAQRLAVTLRSGEEHFTSTRVVDSADTILRADRRNSYSPNDIP